MDGREWKGREGNAVPTATIFARGMSKTGWGPVSECWVILPELLTKREGGFSVYFPPVLSVRFSGEGLVIRHARQRHSFRNPSGHKSLIWVLDKFPTWSSKSLLSHNNISSSHRLFVPHFTQPPSAPQSPPRTHLPKPQPTHPTSQSTSPYTHGLSVPHSPDWPATPSRSQLYVQPSYHRSSRPPVPSLQ